MYWSYILAAIGIVGLYLIGRKNAIGWVIGIIAQLLWVIYASVTQQYGFILMAFCYAWVYVHGLRNFDRPRPIEPVVPKAVPSVWMPQDETDFQIRLGQAFEEGYQERQRELDFVEKLQIQNRARSEGEE